MVWLRRLMVGAALVLCTSQGPVSAAPAPVAPAAMTFRLGALQVTSLADAANVLNNDGGVFGVEVGPAAVASVLAAAGAPTDKVTLAVDALLVRSQGRTMVFDTGLGSHAHGVLVASLAMAGVQPDQVTDVFITHSHFDHVGGLATGDGRLTFPSATIHMSAPEWTWMQSQTQGRALADLIRSKVQPFQPGAVVAPGVTSIALFGHTPGHVGYDIASGHDRLIDVGDLVHSSIVSLAKPDWAIGYDQDRRGGATLRRATLEKLAADHQRIFAPHLPFPGIGEVVSQGGAFVWKPDRPDGG